MRRKRVKARGIKERHRKGLRKREGERETEREGERWTRPAASVYTNITIIIDTADQFRLIKSPDKNHSIHQEVSAKLELWLLSVPAVFG